MSSQLCPAHSADIRALECTSGFDGCGVTEVRRSRKGAGRPIKYPIPADIGALPVSRQRKLQLTLARLGLCVVCGSTDVVRSGMCLYHWVRRREYRRGYAESWHRNIKQKSYQDELNVVGRLGGVEDDLGRLD
jgi:hypothetical protein